MAQKFVSAGVFTKEIDQSFLAQGVAGIGAAVIGRTKKGPAMVPVTVQGYDSFAEIFGDEDPKLQLPYLAKRYLRNSTALTVVRVLGHNDGTSVTNGYTVGGVTAILDQSGSSAQVLAVVHHSGASDVLTISGVALDSNNFIFRVGSIFGVTASFLTSSANYIGKVLNTDPTLYSSYGHYLAKVFSYTKPAASASWNVSPATGYPTGWLGNFTSGSSAWVTSQNVGGTTFNLFRFHTLLHGRATNDDFKVTVANSKPSPSPTATPYGTFDVVIRKFDDTDQRQVILESFVGCTLDPASKNFILRKIGDITEEFDTTQRKFVSNGTWPNKSRYVRVELATDVNYPREAVPFGHRGYRKLSFLTGSVATMTYAVNQYDRNGSIDSNVHWGIVYLSGGIVDRMRAFPDSATTVADTDFSMTFLTSSYTSGKQTWAYNPAIAQSNYHQPVFGSASLYKFSLPFQGGFDGFDLRVDDPLYLSNVADETNIGVVSLKRSIDCIANPDAFDLNILAIPGIHNLKVTDYARNMVNNRADALYVMDVTGSSVAEATQQLKSREIDDNYTAAYYPDLKLSDQVNNRMVRVAPSVGLLPAIAFSDRVGQVFFAPAGMTRGGLGQFDIVDVVDRLTFTDRNDLYDNRLNPIATFPNEGIVVWGQKTLQIRASALDRVNVRRLLIFSKKTIAAAAKLLVFEPGNPVTWERFTKAVNPILDKIRQDQGLERFKVVMDTTTNTPDVIDRNVMAGKIFLQPTKSAEFIDLSFIITSAGVSFGE